MKLWSLQLLRAIAAIGVVFCHIYAWEHAYLKEHAVTPAFFMDGGNGVSLFFVISGFIMVFIEPLPLRSLTGYLRFFIHRFTRIYPPLWLVLIPLTALWLIQPNLFNNIYNNHVDIVRSYLLLPQDYGPLLGPAWTLIHEVYFYVAVSIPLALGLRGRWIYGMLWFVTVLAVYMTYGHTQFHDNRMLQVIFSPFCLTFLLGYFIGLSYERIKSLPWQGALAILGLSIVLYYALPYWTFKSDLTVSHYPNNNSLTLFLRKGIPCAFVAIAALALERYMQQIPLILKRLGDASYAIYLVHLPIVTGIYRIIKALKIYNPAFLSVCVLFSLGISLLLSWYFHIYLEKPVTRICRSFLESRLGVAEKPVDATQAKACT